MGEWDHLHGKSLGEVFDSFLPKDRRVAIQRGWIVHMVSLAEGGGQRTAGFPNLADARRFVEALDESNSAVFYYIAKVRNGKFAKPIEYGHRPGRTNG